MQRLISKTEIKFVGIALAILVLSLMVACASPTTPIANNIAPTAPSAVTAQSQIPAWLDKAVFDQVGEMPLSFESGPQRVVVFEEKHTSRAGQIEMAIMLNRLYSKYGLRHLALEGAVIEKDAPDASWFHKLPDSAARREVALQLLGQGGISAAEFMAMVFNDFQLHRIELEAEYSVEISDQASRAPTDYLLAIAVKMLSPEQLNRANELCAQGKIQECIDVLFGSDPWMKSHYDALSKDDPSIEELITVIDEIKAKASEVNADVSEYTSALQEAKDFFVAASKRSDTMVNKTIPKVRAHPEAPVAFVIGAAHTAKVFDLLKGQSVSIAVLTPLSLGQPKQNGDLYTIAYNRKLRLKSADTAGRLGAFLDGRRKPASVLNERWFQLKAKIMYAIVKVAQAAGAGGSPPYGLNKDLVGAGEPEFDPSSIEIVDGWVMFALRIGGTTLSIGARQESPKSDISDNTTLEQVLLSLLTDVKSEPEILTPADEKRKETEYSTENPAKVRVSRDVVAIVSTNANAVRLKIKEG